MGKYVSWVHGNAVTVESPESLEPGGHNFGWGTDLILKSSGASWFHAPLPVPSIVDDSPVRLRRVFLLFETEIKTELRAVHIHDGSRLLQEFNDIHRDGNYRSRIVPGNTFTLSKLHMVRRGIGISFFIQGSTYMGSDAVPNRVIIPAIGAEFEVNRPFLSVVANAFTDIIRRGP